MHYENEHWKAIPSFPGYEASDQGRIRSIDRVVERPAHTLRHDFHRRATIVRRKACVLSPWVTKAGYQQVRLCIAGKTTTQTVHRLCCETFHGPPPTASHMVAHNNGVPTDNRSSNLRWATAVENAADRELHGNQRRGEAVSNAKLSDVDVMLIRAIDATHRDIAALFGVSRVTVSTIRRRDSWTHVPPMCCPSRIERGPAA